MTWDLHNGAGKPLLRVVRDGCYPGMWRVCYPDGRLSDMANLPRAKDAAEVISLRAFSGIRLFRWKGHVSESPGGGHLQRFSRRGRYPNRGGVDGVWRAA
jgi:hypothetical protein